MLIYSLQAMVTVGLVVAWRRLGRAPAVPPATPPVDRRVHPKVAARSLEVRVVFVDVVEGGGPALLDCVLTEPYGTVAPGAVFRMAVALPRLIDGALLARFERWADADTIIHLVVTEGARAPKASFSAGGTRVDLDLVASSPLRAAGRRPG